MAQEAAPTNEDFPQSSLIWPVSSFPFSGQDSSSCIPPQSFPVLVNPKVQTYNHSYLWSWRASERSLFSAAISPTL
jgi:hypothetical protein